MRARANAWAIGDLEAIFKVSVADREGACRAAMFDNPVMKAQPGLQSVQARLRAVWLDTATKALDAHAATFAVLQPKEVLDPRGVLALLQAKGYQVEHRNRRAQAASHWARLRPSCLALYSAWSARSKIDS
jgi:hypothetical protein